MTVLYTEMCCRLGGSNLNAGTLDGSTTVVAAAAKMTYTGGDWNSATRVFTVNGGQSMTEAVVGRYMSVYADADTAPTSNSFTLGKISSVVGTAITLDATTIFLFGTGSATAAASRSAKIGGAWLGPNAAVTWPINNAIAPLRLSDTQRLRINFCNDQSYVCTPGNLGVNASAATHYRGFTAAYGDGGRATFDGGAAGASAVLMSTNAGAPDTEWADLEFKRNGLTGGANLITNASNSVIYRRCVFRDCRGAGFSNSLGCLLEECEFYGCNQNNDSPQAGCVSTNSQATFRRVKSHNNTTANSCGFRSTFGATFNECIAHKNGLHGAIITGVGRTDFSRCDFYDNGGSGVNTSQGILFDSCNFLKNAVYGIDLNVTSVERMCIAVNCGFGSGTKANTTADCHNAVIEEGSTTYAANTTPWNAPDTGDFTVTNAGAKTGARDTFTETMAGFSGTVSAASRSAAQAASATVADYPATANVRSGVAYNSGALVGTLTPYAGHEDEDVEGVIEFSPNAVSVSTPADYPSVGNVRFGVSFNFGGSTGTLAVPAATPFFGQDEDDVEDVMQYGAGTLAAAVAASGGGSASRTLSITGAVSVQGA